MNTPLSLICLSVSLFLFLSLFRCISLPLCTLSPSVYLCLHFSHCLFLFFVLISYFPPSFSLSLSLSLTHCSSAYFISVRLCLPMHGILEHFRNQKCLFKNIYKNTKKTIYLDTYVVYRQNANSLSIFLFNHLLKFQDKISSRQALCD